jgi:hypothetical protein
MLMSIAVALLPFKKYNSVSSKSNFHLYFDGHYYATLHHLMSIAMIIANAMI